MIARVADLVCAGLPLSVTAKVKEKMPAAVGVPETVPFEARPMPLGRAPEARAQV